MKLLPIHFSGRPIQQSVQYEGYRLQLPKKGTKAYLKLDIDVFQDQVDQARRAAEQGIKKPQVVQAYLTE